MSTILLAAGLSQETFVRVVLLLAAVSVGYLMTHLVVERLARRFGVAGGIEYVVLGVVLGPLLGVLDGELARDVRPVLLLGAGALGMLAGLELGERRGDESLRGTWAAALSLTAFTGLAVIGLPLLVAGLLGHALTGERAWTAALLFAGVVALGSEGAAIGRLATLLGARGPAPGVAIAVANRVRALATLGLGLFYALIDDAAALQLRPWPQALGDLAIQLGAGVVFGLLFAVLVHRRLDERTLLTVIVGMVFLAGGFAYAVGVSAIVVNFVAGLTFARASSHAAEVTGTMRSIEQPFVIALHFFAGLEWTSGQPWVFALIVPFLLLRHLGRRVGGALASRLGGVPANLGPATDAPGGLTLAFVLSVGLVYRQTPGIIDVYGPLVIASLVLELVSPRSVRRWLVDAAGLGSEPANHRHE